MIEYYLIEQETGAQPGRRTRNRAAVPGELEAAWTSELSPDAYIDAEGLNYRYGRAITIL